MKKVLLMLMFLAWVLNHSAWAESLHPNEVVRLFLQSLQQNDLQKVLDTADLIEIASHPRHAMSPEQLVKFFKNVDLDKIKFQERDAMIWAQTMTVRILEPISYDFDLELQKAILEKQEDHYIVVELWSKVVYESLRGGVS